MQTVAAPPVSRRLEDQSNDVLVKAYIALRDRRVARKSAYDADDADDKKRQARIEAILLVKFNDSGVELVRTQYGTAYKSQKVSISVANWDDFLDFVVDTEAWDMLERRASKTAVESWRETNAALPPGLNRREETEINIRRA